MDFPVKKADQEWQQELTPEQYRIARQRGTERAFTGAYWDEHRPGTYRCVCCGQELYVSQAKFDSGCGWPSFHSPAQPEAVVTQPDTSHGMVRTELRCSRCGAHLGHLFDDGPQPTGQRHCINSAILKFDPDAGK